MSDIGMVPHGDRRCEALGQYDDTERFFCVLCHRVACWCTGCADQPDEALRALYTAPVPTDDPGVCDECWSSLAGNAGFVATWVVR